MRTIAVIPARYNSSRFRGKPLADLCGRPMLWWVYHQVRRAKGIDEVIVATDDERILDACRQYEIPCRMTAEPIAPVPNGCMRWRGPSRLRCMSVSTAMSR